MDDIDLIEAMKPSPPQARAVARALNIPDEKLNVNGGAIALGHPIGAIGPAS
jgi:acetyl-CoA acetyltransferase